MSCIIICHSRGAHRILKREKKRPYAQVQRYIGIKEKGKWSTIFITFFVYLKQVQLVRKTFGQVHIKLEHKNISVTILSFLRWNVYNPPIQFCWQLSVAQVKKNYRFPVLIDKCFIFTVVKLRPLWSDVHTSCMMGSSSSPLAMM